MSERKVQNSSNGEQVAPRRSKKVCYFCENKKDPSYTDTVTLRKFLSDRSRIIPRLRSGACSRHQRMITREIKHARHLALLPFITRV
ncbi:30S ribosomal protein S18 [Candidatus Daviesbacteria bacterium]|nr:30S ribosomal protein S18 [Candidatus Daviesbacteria bacterium]